MANKKHRGAMLSMLASMQSLGILAHGAVVLAALNWFKSPIAETSRDNVVVVSASELDLVWRLSVGIGVVAGVLALAVARYNLLETPRFTIEVDNDYEKATHDLDIIMFGHEKSKKQSAADLEIKSRLGSNRPSVREFCSFFFTSTSQLRLMFLGICVPRFVIHTVLYGLCLNAQLLFNMIGMEPYDHVYSSVFSHAVGQTIVNLISLPGYL